MTVYNLPDDITFTKTIITPGHGLYAPNEGSNCKVIIKFSPTDYVLNENKYNDLLPLNEEINIHLGFYSTVISNYVHKCLVTMKQNELSQLDFDYSSHTDENQTIKIVIHLISFERFPEIYSMSIDNLYNFALKHKENANKFFQHKNYCQAFKLYHRSLCYVLNFINEQPIDEHNEILENFNQLILSIYSNISACQLIYGNNINVIANCSSALEINPKYVKALYRRGCAYANLKDYELALKDIELANKIQPHDEKIENLFKTTKQRLEEYNKTLGNSLKHLF
ncbi:unnamed protein product [Rotaria socialis]|uniref:Uncharacterized protein n=1 Tax=Rotaria socialis TaxID=392032 RepID=A0A817P0X1_9BILA|nr:unnamed protein product [Rotaria socialis]CAF3163582.1 unnamed protein product [Rotaria socialis]CAF3563364.1 unnamed protein product [Rotaria socialis]CAF4226405.1 unnamed protein product [Rotaria socialis]CAF4237951.1 unnamed protein product [Rotaria socialis]